MSPPLTGAPFALADADASLARYTPQRFTALFNVLGQPAISLPAGTDRIGMPFGLQLAGYRHQDGALLAAAAEVTDLLGASAGTAPPSPQM
jgi:aspartyl-tRNA(Asn)/glutamyl-tRNA(Gln) amidotransferase subunit A